MNKTGPEKPIEVRGDQVLVDREVCDEPHN